MSIVLDFQHAARRRGALLDQLQVQGDTVEAALEKLERGDRPADVLADVFRAGIAYARRNDTGHADELAADALDAIDELAARRAQRGGDAS